MNLTDPELVRAAEAVQALGPDVACQGARVLWAVVEAYQAGSIAVKVRQPASGCRRAGRLR